MSFDANAYRQASFEGWEEAAAGWRRREPTMRDFTGPVSHWLVEAISPQPGERVLELAAGLGEPGLLAAELVAPGGGVIISDQAEAMLEGARARALELGLENVEFRALNAESLDVPLASIDAVLCRWGYMLMADPPAALTEARRVLCPDGRLALAVWDTVDTNPWAQLPTLELIERGIAPAPQAGDGWAPGMFSLADRSRLGTVVADAGFASVRVDALDLRVRHPDFTSLWETTLDLSRPFHDAVLSREASEIAEIRASLAERFAAYRSAEGALEIPGRTLVACASA